MDTVIVVHGRGLGPESTKLVAHAFPTGRILAPSGPVTSKRGRTWFEIVRTGIAHQVSVRTAEHHMMGWIDDTIDPEVRPLLTDFSNGGALAVHLLVHRSHRFRGAALFAAPLVLPPWPTGALAGKPVFYAHGDAADTVVNQGFYADATSYLLGASEARATVRRYAAGHVIDGVMMSDYGAWFGPEEGTGLNSDQTDASE